MDARGAAAHGPADTAPARRRGGALAAVQLLLATAWVGALWTVGALVAPGLFAALPDRVLAGTLAGRFFAAVGWLGLGCGAGIVAIAVLRARLRTRLVAVAAVMWLCSAASLFVIQPEVARLRDAAGGRPVQGTALARPFAAWHAVSSAVYLVQGVLGIVLILSWRRQADADR